MTLATAGNGRFSRAASRYGILLVEGLVVLALRLLVGDGTEHPSGLAQEPAGVVRIGQSNDRFILG